MPVQAGEKYGRLTTRYVNGRTKNRAKYGIVIATVAAR